MPAPAYARQSERFRQARICADMRASQATAILSITSQRQMMSAGRDWRESVTSKSPHRPRPTIGQVVKLMVGVLVECEECGSFIRRSDAVVSSDIGEDAWGWDERMTTLRCHACGNTWVDRRPRPNLSGSGGG